MRHLDLFSGIGGFALAARWAGIETVGFCEIEEFPRKVLQKNFPGVSIHHDIRELNGEEYVGIDLITGGYPCQPFSTVGKRRGTEDDRHLWPEMLRVITQAKPTWVVCENVYGHVTMGLDEVLADMESEGYAAQPFVVPACAKDAPHRRYRVWVIAHSTGIGSYGVIPTKRRDLAPDIWGEWKEWEIKPVVLGEDDGLPDRVDRIKGLGNAIVPQVAYEILRTIRAV